jgi:CO/xanthine dehydrogenase Mo-binding subunit
MSEKPLNATFIEPERYEFTAPPLHRFDMDRRDFVKIFGGGIVILISLGDPLAAQESGGVRRSSEEKLPQEIGAWLQIGEDGTVTVFTGKVEMGQNIRTSLSQAVADELRVPLEHVRLVMGDTQLTPFDMGTFGSRTTPTMAPQLRKAAAAARELLVNLAAKKWNVDPGRLVAADGKVTDSQTKSAFTYGQLAAGQTLAKTIDADPVLTPPDRWTIAGKPVRKVDGRDFVTGRHQYTSDLQRPGMMYGKIVRPPSFGATLISADRREARAIPGVAVAVDGDFIGVAAPSEPLAARAAAAIHAEWKTVPQPSGKDLFEYLKKTPTEGEGLDRRLQHMMGSMEQGLAAADHGLQQTYTVAFIAHAPLEPRAALAEWQGEKLTVWTGTQRPFAVRDELAGAFHLPKSQVRVLVPDTGSAYGGKHTGECAVEAARLARAAGHPVKLVWSREEEFTWAYFRPAGVIEISSGVKTDGTVTAWEFHNYNSGTAAIATPYAIANQKIEFHPVRSPLRQGSYRGLAATANHFARETHMDELAHLVKMDPLEFHLKNVQNDRLRAVFEAAAKAFGWARAKSAEGQGFGIAGGIEKGGYVATCAEVASDRAGGEVKVKRLVTAFECGAIVNPDGLKNQIEGAMMMGIGGALFEAIEFENGRILNARFSRYRVPRFSDMPQLEVVLVDRKDLPSAGAGETPIMGTAPAIGSAIFDAIGIRLRSLPMAPNGLKS